MKKKIAKVGVIGSLAAAAVLGTSGVANAWSSVPSGDGTIHHGYFPDRVACLKVVAVMALDGREPSPCDFSESTALPGFGGGWWFNSQR